MTVWRIAVTREIVHRITRIVLVDVDESGIHGENVERGLTEGLPVGQEMVIIEIDDNGNVYIYINGAYAVYTDRKGHSGLYVTMEKSAMMRS